MRQVSTHVGKSFHYIKRTRCQNITTSPKFFFEKKSLTEKKVVSLHLENDTKQAPRDPHLKTKVASPYLRSSFASRSEHKATLQRPF